MFDTLWIRLSCKIGEVIRQGAPATRSAPVFQALFEGRQGEQGGELMQAAGGCPSVGLPRTPSASASGAALGRSASAEGSSHLNLRHHLDVLRQRKAMLPPILQGETDRLFHILDRLPRPFQKNRESIELHFAHPHSLPAGPLPSVLSHLRSAICNSEGRRSGSEVAHAANASRMSSGNGAVKSGATQTCP